MALPNEKEGKIMNEEMVRLISIFKSLVVLSNWDVERFDIQKFISPCNSKESYVGYVTIKGDKRTLMIRPSGTFEWLED